MSQWSSWSIQPCYISSESLVCVTLGQAANTAPRRPVVMDSHISLQTENELWRVQVDLKSLATTQAEHSDRLHRLERRLDEDNRIKSVWGPSSPFPGVLSGTPHQGSIGSSSSPSMQVLIFQ